MLIWNGWFRVVTVVTLILGNPHIWISVAWIQMIPSSPATTPSGKTRCWISLPWNPKYFNIREPVPYPLPPPKKSLQSPGQGGETGAAGTRTSRARTGDPGPGAIVDREFGESLGGLDPEASKTCWFTIYGFHGNFDVLYGICNDCGSWVWWVIWETNGDWVNNHP